MKRNFILIALTLLLMFAVSNVLAQDGRRIVLREVTNSWDSGGIHYLVPGQSHKFTFKYEVLSPVGGCETVTYAPNTGFVVTSDGANLGSWTVTVTQALKDAPKLNPNFNCGFINAAANKFEDPVGAGTVPMLDGLSPDYFVVFGVPNTFCADPSPDPGPVDVSQAGVGPGFDDDAFHFTVMSQLADEGKTVCVDTSSLGKVNTFTWAGIGAAPCGVAPNVYDLSRPALPRDNTQGEKFCWTILVPPDLPPEITNCPQAALEGSHCDVMTYDFDAVDTDDTPGGITYHLESGPGGIDAGTGMWSYAPSINDVGAALSITVYAADANNAQGGGRCTVDLVFTNEGPTIQCPGGQVTVQLGNEACQQVTADDDCDVLSWSIVGHTGTDMNAVSIDNDGLVCYTPVEGDDAIGNITTTVQVSDGLASAECTVNWFVIAGAPYNVSLTCIDPQIQGKFAEICVMLNAVDPDPDIGGLGAFDLLIAYDASALSFQSATEGEIYSACGWEYFTYRYGANGNCSNACPTGLLRLVGIRETNDGPNHPWCDVPEGRDLETDPISLACMTFLVSDDRTLECQLVPIRFFWVDCGDNVLSNRIGSRALLSSKVFDYGNPDPFVTGNPMPTFMGAPEECLVSDKVPTERGVDYTNGCIRIVCGDEIDARGDVNVNGLAYEIADAVMFTNYFIVGLSAFQDHVDASIAASDANADGLALSVADLVYLIRVVVGDALPYPKVSADAAKYTNDAGTISVDHPTVGAAYLVVKGEVEPTLLAENMDIKYAFDGVNTNVLVYSLEANSFTGEFVRVSGELLSIEMAAYDGSPVELTNVPSDYALNQNYPNPFNPTTTISMALKNAGDYTLTVYNITGQVVAEFEGTAEAGIVEVEWDASNLASGVYFYKMVAGDFSATKKAVLLK